MLIYFTICDLTNIIEEIRNLTCLDNFSHIIIDGHSMEPTFKNGQVIFVKKLDDCDYNDYGIFCITEYDVTKVVFKRKILLPDGSYCLRSINPDYEDIGGFSEIKTCRCVAKMVLQT